MKKKVRRIISAVLAVVMLCGIIPANATVSKAATTANVSLSSLGRKGTVSFGSKSKSGTWWKMRLGSKEAFCLSLGHTCHSGNTYAAENSYKWDQDTGGEKHGYYAKIIRWYVLNGKRTQKSFVMSQALIWSVSEGRNSEAQLKDVIKQVREKTGTYSSKTVNELYNSIFEPSGNWEASATIWQKTGNSKGYQKLITVDAEKLPQIYTPTTLTDTTYYRQRITVKKKDEDGNGLGGIQFTLDADNLDDLYSFSVSDRDGVESNSADDDNETSFSLTGYTRDSGRLAYRMTYRLQTMDYYYYTDSDLADMDSDAKKAAKKFLTDDLELDEGIDFPSDLTKASAQKMAAQEIKDLMLDRISSFDERLLYVGITIVVKANSIEELEERTEKIKIIGQTHNMDIVPHSHKQLDALNTSLPTGARFVDTMRTITSEELSIFIPFNVQEINDNQGYCYGFNKVSKNLIIGNRKLLKNGNGMVFGVPGSGKSYNEKSEMGQVLCFSTDDIIVIDPMSEYKDIAAAWGGQYINLSQSAENVYYVNPFHVPDVVPDIDRFVAEKAEFAYAICEQALKPTPLTSRHIAVIDKAVRDMYSEYFKQKNDRRRKRKTRLESPTIRTMRDGIAERSEGNDSAIESVEQLEVFADGTLDIFAREQSISEENRFTVYGFSELGKRMRAMAMLVMIESITAKIKYNQSDGVATWVYVDEMHELWGEEYSLHALEKMWREVRKRGGICTGMSQNLIDAQRNRSTKTMVSNSEFMLLLDQGTMDKEAVEDLFDISAEQLACVNGADPGMGLIRFGDKIVPFDNTMKKDSELYQLFNTNFHEIAGTTR